MSAPSKKPGGGIKSGALAGRSMPAAIMLLALPVLAQQLLQAFVGMTDKMLAGHLDAAVRVEALDAIGIGSYVGWFVGIAMSGLGIGGQAIIARSMGAGDKQLASHALGQAMGVSLVWGACVGVIMWAIAPAMAVYTKLGPEAASLFITYLRVFAVSMPAAGVMMVGAMCLYGAGDTRRPALIAIGINFVNIFFSWVLSGADIDLAFLGMDRILTNPFDFDYGVAGIAAGTAIGYVVGAVLTWWVLARGVRDLKLETSELRPRAVMLKRFMRIGVPNFAEGIAMWAVNLFVLSFIGIIAAKTATEGGLQGAHIIAIQWEAFSFMPGFAIGTAAGTLAGQYLGAGDAAAARKAVISCTIIAATLMTLLGVVFMTAGRQLTSVISTEPIHLETVPKLLFICGVVQVFFAITMVVRQGLRGVGDTRWCLAITTFSSYAIRLPATYILGVTMGLGLEGIWYGLCGEFVIRACLFTARFLHGGWQRVTV